MSGHKKEEKKRWKGPSNFLDSGTGLCLGLVHLTYKRREGLFFFFVFSRWVATASVGAHSLARHKSRGNFVITGIHWRGTSNRIGSVNSPFSLSLSLSLFYYGEQQQQQGRMTRWKLQTNWRTCTLPLELIRYARELSQLSICCFLSFDHDVD